MEPELRLPLGAGLAQDDDATEDCSPHAVMVVMPGGCAPDGRFRKDLGPIGAGSPAGETAVRPAVKAVVRPVRTLSAMDIVRITHLDPSPSRTGGFRQPGGP